MAPEVMTEIECKFIDVCMIVYNESTVIDRCINALLSSGFDSFVILDMQSTDGTPGRIKQLTGDKAIIHIYPRSSLLRYGYAEARNVCAAFSSRECILFVDADEVLISGCDAGKIQIKTLNISTCLYSIERHNLARKEGTDPEAIFTRSVEVHNRLYVPSLRQKWVGYIHEEIHIDDRSGSRQNGETSLVFDHYSELKPVLDQESKEGLYALMLIRGANQPAVRAGTDSWFFDVYIPQHRDLLEKRALKYARRNGIHRSFYAVEEEGARAFFLHDYLIQSITTPNASEMIFDCGVIRKLHAVSAAPWTQTSELAFWGEWNHPGESNRSLSLIIDGMKLANWNLFIKPGIVCIDIGGHSGDTSIPMGLFSFDANSQKRGLVVVVEPNLAVSSVLDINLALNSHIGEFYTVYAAITKSDIDKIELADHGNAECNGGILDGCFSKEVKQKLNEVAGKRYNARGVSLETLFKKISDHVSKYPVGFIKINCVGYDKEIIKPCRELFARSKPTLFINWFDWFVLEDNIDLFATIEALDYIPLHPISLRRADLNARTSNLLCIHKNSDTSVICSEAGGA